MAPTKVQTQTPTPKNKKISHNHNAHKQEMQAKVKVYKILAQFASSSAMAQHTPFASYNIMLIYKCMCVAHMCCQFTSNYVKCSMPTFKFVTRCMIINV
jgi:hypothetical protein